MDYVAQYNCHTNLLLFRNAHSNCYACFLQIVMHGRLLLKKLSEWYSGNSKSIIHKNCYKRGAVFYIMDRSGMTRLVLGFDTLGL